MAGGKNKPLRSVLEMTISSSKICGHGLAAHMLERSKIAIDTADELLKVIEYAQQHQKLDAQWHIDALQAVDDFKKARQRAYDGND